MKQTTKLRRAFGTMALGVMMAASIPVIAQERMQMKTPEQRAQNQTQMMKNKLSLDQAQETKVQAINLKYAQQADPIMKGAGDRADKMKKLSEMQQAKETDLKGVLSESQFKQYQQMEQNMRQRFGGGQPKTAE